MTKLSLTNLDNVSKESKENRLNIFLLIQNPYLRARKAELSFTPSNRSWTFCCLWLVSRFAEKNIPVPFRHRGDTGVSEEFPDNIRILVAICNATPTAYCVRLGANGSLKPKSHRFLEESYLHDGDGNHHNLVYLHDIGSGRFCVIYCSFSMPLMIYVFKIDYAREHEIQNSATIISPKKSSEILCSRKFLDDIPLFGKPRFYACCLAPASGNQTAGAPTNERTR